MLVTTTLLLAVLAAAQLPAHVRAVPLPDAGALDAVDVACPEGHLLNGACEGLLTRVVHDDLVDPLIKRIEIPEIAPEDPVPVTGPNPNPDPAIPDAQDPHPVVITPTPKVTEKPAPTQKLTETGATVTDATPTEIGITTITDEAQLCARSADGLWSRSDRDPRSGDTNPDAGGFDSEPQNVDVQPAAGEAPAIDRTKVKN